MIDFPRAAGAIGLRARNLTLQLGGMDQHGGHEYQLTFEFPEPTSLHAEVTASPMRRHAASTPMGGVLLVQVSRANPDPVVKRLDPLQQSDAFLDPQPGDAS